MSKIGELKNKFQVLSLNEKKEKLITVFEEFKGTNAVFDEVLYALHNNPRVDDEFLIASYGEIITLAGNIDELKQANRVKHLQENMKSLHEKEKLERSLEDPETKFVKIAAIRFTFS